MKPDSLDWTFPYTSQRMPVLAGNAVATSQPLAAEAGLQALRKGGNALDAALACAICLTVVEPTSNGIGGDAFALVWDGSRLHGINGSGRSPAAWTPDRFAGRPTMPPRGIDSVTVPGQVAAWADLHERFGKLPFETLFSEAVRHARDGFPVSPITAKRWAVAPDAYRKFPEFGETFLPAGRPPEPGETFRCPDMADTLEEIAATRGVSFYRGRLAERLAAHVAKRGGALTAGDLDAHRSWWVAPIETDFRGNTLHEIPPNGQGITALVALALLERTDIADHVLDSAASLHLQIEAVKQALHVAYRHVGDPDFMERSSAQILAGDRIDALAENIDPGKAAPLVPGTRNEGGTVYLTTADASGMMVSYIQSNFYGFGSGIVVPGTGIALQSRGFGFTLESGHPNQVGGSKRPFHTIIPGFVTRGGKPLMSFGVMGGTMQAQGHVQLMVRIGLFGQNPQAALDAPRFFVLSDGRVALEPGLSGQVYEGLSALGHRLVTDHPTPYFGGAQLIYRLGDAYCAASDPRKDGLACGF